MDFFTNSSSFNDSVVNNEDRTVVTDRAQQVLTFDKVSRIVTPLVIGLFLLIGLIGNTLVIYVTMTTQRVIKHPVHSMLVLNLAVADILYLLASAPYQAIANSVPKWIYGSFLCPAFHYVTIQTMAVSIFTMCSLAVMRFMALMMPFKIQRSFITTSARLTGCVIIIAVWFLASILAVPNAIYFQLREGFPYAYETTYECYWSDVIQKRSYSVALLVVTYVIPFMLVVVLYFFICREIFCYMRIKKPAVHAELGGRNEQSEYMKTTAMIFSLIIAFLVCWFPYHLYAMIVITKEYKTLEYGLLRSVLEMVGHCMSYAHACVNPIIYTFAAPGFRRNLSLTFRPIGCLGSVCRSCIGRRGRVDGTKREVIELKLCPNNNSTVTRLTTACVTRDNSSSGGKSPVDSRIALIPS